MRARTHSLRYGLAKLVDLVEVVGLDRLGVDLDGLMRLVVLEPSIPSKGKRASASSRMWKMIRSWPANRSRWRAFKIGSGVAQQVAEEHDQAAMPDHAGDLVQALRDLGRSGRLELGQQRQDIAELRPLAPRRQALPDLLVEGDQADGILLVDHQVAEGRRQADAVLELRQLLAVGVAHRAGEVHHQVAGQVGLGLKFLDVEPVGLGEDVPVDVGDVVARRCTCGARRTRPRTPGTGWHAGRR